MNATEAKMCKRLRSGGWTVLRSGWPDFFCIRLRDGAYEAQAVEVKNGEDPVRPNQKRMHTALKRAGIPVVVETDKTAESFTVISASITRNDDRLLMALQRKLDSPTVSETVRLAIRELAKAEGVK